MTTSYPFVGNVMSGTGTLGDTPPVTELLVSTKFMEGYEIIRSVSGGSDITTFLNDAGNLDVYSVGTANTVHRIRSLNDANAGWVQTDLGIKARQISLFNRGFDENNPDIFGLNDNGMLTLSTYDPSTGSYSQKVSQPPDNTKAIKRFLSAKGFTNIYANVILENDEVATSFIKPDGTWASKQWVPVKAPGSTENAKVSRIAMCANNPVQTALYAVAINNDVLFAESSSRFTQFTKLGSLKAIDLSVVQDSKGLLNIFAIDTSFHLWWKQQKEHSSGSGIEFKDWVQIDKRVALSFLKAVINAEGLLEIFGIGNDGLLYHTRQAAQNGVVSWGFLFPLGNPVPNSIFTVGRTQDGYSEAYTVTNDNRLYRFWQDPNTTQWYNYEILLQESGEMASLPTHSVEVTVLDYAGMPRPDSKVQIKSSNLTSFRINGLYYIVSEFKGVTCKTNSAGKVVIERNTTSLSAPSLFITTDYMVDGITIEPNASLQQKIHATTKDDVLNAKTRDGKYLLDGEYRTPENAENIAKIMQKSMSLGDPVPTTASLTAMLAGRSRSPAGPRRRPRGAKPSPFHLDLSRVQEQHWQVDFSSGAPRYREFTRTEAAALIQAKHGALAVPQLDLDIDWGDVWNSIKEGVSSIVSDIKDFIVTTIINPATGLIDKIEVLFTLLVDGVERLFSAVITAFQQAFDIVEGIWNKVKAFFKELYEWLAFLFAWKDIERTAEAIKHTFNQTLDFMVIGIQAVKNQVASAFERMEGVIDKAVDDFLAVLNGQQTLGQYTNDNSVPQPALESSTNHNVLLNSFMDNYKDTQVNRSASLSASLNFDKLIQELQELAENFEFDQGKEAFQEGMDYFSAIGTDPDRALQLVLSGTIKVMESVVLFGFEVTKGILLSILDLVADIVQLTKDLLNEDWEIPFVSQLYKLITGDSLSFKPINLFSLILAVPATIFYKVVKNEAPFPDSGSVDDFKRAYTAQWLAEQSGIIPPAKALSPEAALAAQDVREKVRAVFICLFSAVYVVRIFIETAQVTLAAIGDPVPVPLGLAITTARFLNSCFSIPWVMSASAGGFSCTEPQGFNNLIWLLQIILGPGVGFVIVYANTKGKLKPPVNDIRFTIWGAVHLGMFIALAIMEKNPSGPKTAMNVLTCLAPQLLRFMAIQKVITASKGASAVGLILLIVSTYLVIACINVTNLDEAELNRANGLFARPAFA